jgi:TRAP-type C4-dicarboxylate transport system permease small subunit
MPELSRQRVHIFISIVLDIMPVRYATFFQHAAYVVAAIACIMAAWFCSTATMQQFLGNIQTVNEWRIDKWMLSIAIPYGLASTAIYYIRHVVRREPYATAEGLQT